MNRLTICLLVCFILMKNVFAQHTIDWKNITLDGSEYTLQIDANILELN